MKRLFWLACVGLLNACGGSSGQTSSPTTSPSTPEPPAPTPTPAPRPETHPSNVVIFIIDDLALTEANFAHSGSPTTYTPHIDDLAKHSIVLDNFHVTSPMCTPSRYSLLTGKYASRATSRYIQSRRDKEGYSVPASNMSILPTDGTLPKRLRAIGYRTGFTGKDHVMVPERDFAMPDGSSIYDPGVARMAQDDQKERAEGIEQRGFDQAYCIYEVQPDAFPVKELRGHNLDCITDGAISFLDTIAAKHFFLYVSLTIPHEPLSPELSWNNNPSSTPGGLLSAPLRVQPARSTLSPRVQAAGFPGQENFLWLDDSVAAVLDKLKSLGVFDDTMIVFLGDHGMSAVGSAYYGGSHTPAFVYYRGVTGRSGQLISNLDIGSTILDLLGVPDVADGHSFLSILNGSDSPIHAYLYFEMGYARAVLQGDYEYIALRHSPYMVQQAARNSVPLTEWPDYTSINLLEERNLATFPHYLERDQLYNWRLDPEFKNNLIDDPSLTSVLLTLKRTMQKTADQTPGIYPVF